MDSAGGLRIASEEHITISTKQNVTVPGDLIASGFSSLAWKKGRCFSDPAIDLGKEGRTANPCLESRITQGLLQ